MSVLSPYLQTNRANVRWHLIQWVVWSLARRTYTRHLDAQLRPELWYPRRLFLCLMEHSMHASTTSPKSADVEKKCILSKPNRTKLWWQPSTKSLFWPLPHKIRVKTKAWSVNGSMCNPPLKQHPSRSLLTVTNVRHLLINAATGSITQFNKHGFTCLFPRLPYFCTNCSLGDFYFRFTLNRYIMRTQDRIIFCLVWINIRRNTFISLYKSREIIVSEKWNKEKKHWEHYRVWGEDLVVTPLHCPCRYITLQNNILNFLAKNGIWQPLALFSAESSFIRIYIYFKD